VSYYSGVYSIFHRFIKDYVDSLQPDKTNRYVYCYNNPINLTDPLGLEPEKEKTAEVKDAATSEKKGDTKPAEAGRSSSTGTENPGESSSGVADGHGAGKPDASSASSSGEYKNDAQKRNEQRKWADERNKETPTAAERNKVTPIAAIRNVADAARIAARRIGNPRQQPTQVLTESRLQMEYLDVYNRLQSTSRLQQYNPLHEANFDTTFWEGYDKYRIYIYNGRSYTDKQINYLGIGMYEAWKGNTLTEAQYKATGWKAGYGKTPDNGTMEWLEKGHEKYQQLNCQRSVKTSH